jgi:hypothetical protein
MVMDCGKLVHPLLIAATDKIPPILPVVVVMVLVLIPVVIVQVLDGNVQIYEVAPLTGLTL